MKIIKNNLKKSLFPLLIVGSILSSCGGSKDGKEAGTDELAEPKDSVKTNIVNIGGEIFSIPSPIETAMLLQKVGATYDKSILNPGNKTNQYTSNFLKSLNLGIYGADLGYVCMFNQSQDAIGYLAAVKKIGDDLGVTGAFDANTMKRINENISKKDSMLVLVSVAYRASDSYLKTAKRNDVSGLVLAGGWIESLYFSTSVLKGKDNAELKARIAEQSGAIESIIKLLTPYASQPEFNDLLNDMLDLQTVFSTIEIKYEFIAPETNEANKTTTVNCKSEVNITKEQLNQITEKINKIRSKIISPAA